MRQFMLILFTVTMAQSALAKTHDIGYGTFEAPEDFERMRTGTADSFKGTLRRKSDGFTINFDAGWMAGVHMSDAKKAQCTFYRSHSVGGVMASTGIEHIGGRQRITTTVHFDSQTQRAPANFWAEVRLDSDVAEFLLIVTSYKPKLGVSAEDSRRAEPPVVRRLRAELPAGWNCAVYQSNKVTVVPHGLEKPAFEVVASNTNLSFARFPDAPRPTMQNPVIPLYFYCQSEKAGIMETIKKESNFSWSIPIYFGETDEFVVVTSPAFVNGGLFTQEARHALLPMWQVLRDLIPKKEETGVDDLAADK